MKTIKLANDITFGPHTTEVAFLAGTEVDVIPATNLPNSSKIKYWIVLSDHENRDPVLSSAFRNYGFPIREEDIEDPKLQHARNIVQRMAKAGFMSGWVGNISFTWQNEQAKTLMEMGYEAFRHWVTKNECNLREARVSYIDIIEVLLSKTHWTVK